MLGANARAPLLAATVAYGGPNTGGTFDLRGINPQVLLEASAGAELYALQGSDEALRFIAAVEPVQPTEASALRALLFHHQKRHAAAAEAAISAFRALRTDPWADVDVIRRLLRIVPVLGAAERGKVDALVASLSEPFAALAHDWERRTALVRLFHRLGDKRCVEALSFFEEHVVWDLAQLQQRADCYALAQHPLRERALDDLAEYLAGEASSLDARLPNSPLP